MIAEALLLLWRQPDRRTILPLPATTRSASRITGLNSNERCMPPSRTPIVTRSALDRSTTMNAVFTPTRHKLTVDDYHKLGDAGVLNEDSRVELIEGELIEMAPIGGPHMGLINRLNKLLVFAVGDAGVVSMQNAVTLPPWSEPQPDFAILRPGADTRHAPVPNPPDVLWLIEVADTTLAYDRRTKVPIYARAGILEVWVVDANACAIEVFHSPRSNGYSHASIHAAPARISPTALPGVVIDVADVFA